MLIVFEGIDGSGKSSLLKALSQYLTSKKVEHIVTAEPGGSGYGQALKQISKSELKKQTPNYDIMYLAFALDRAMHIQEKIIPALKEKKLILCDRFFDSSLVYQGLHCQEHFLKDIFERTSGNIQPDITIFMDTPIEKALLQMHQRGLLDEYDLHAQSRLQALTDAYKKLYSSDHYKNKKILHVDGSKTLNENLEYIIEKLF